MIKNRIDHLKKDLISEKFTIEQLFQRHIVDIHSYFFVDVMKNASNEYRVRELVANALGIHINEVLIMGSAKLGYSLSPKKLYREFDYNFNLTQEKKDKSDLDISVISSDYFKKLNVSMYNFTNAFRTRWKDNEYYKGVQLRAFDVPINYKFFEYHTKGWFRPDFKPQGFEFCVYGTYEQLRKEIHLLTGRKIGLAIYKNWFYFKQYHMENLNRLQTTMKIEIL